MYLFLLNQKQHNAYSFGTTYFKINVAASDLKIICFLNIFHTKRYDVTSILKSNIIINANISCRLIIPRTDSKHKILN